MDSGVWLVRALVLCETSSVAAAELLRRRIDGLSPLMVRVEGRELDLVFIQGGPSPAVAAWVSLDALLRTPSCRPLLLLAGEPGATGPEYLLEIDGQPKTRSA